MDINFSVNCWSKSFLFIILSHVNGVDETVRPLQTASCWNNQQQVYMVYLFIVSELHSRMLKNILVLLLSQTVVCLSESRKCGR